MQGLTNCNLSYAAGIECCMTDGGSRGSRMEVGRGTKMKNSNFLRLIFVLSAALVIACAPAPAFAQHGGGGHGGGGGGGFHGGGGGGFHGGGGGGGFHGGGGRHPNFRRGGGPAGTGRRCS